MMYLAIVWQCSYWKILMSFCRNLLPADISCMVHPEVHRAYRNCVIMYLNYTSGTETCKCVQHMLEKREYLQGASHKCTIEIQEFANWKVGFSLIKVVFSTRTHSGMYMLYFKAKVTVSLISVGNMRDYCHLQKLKRFILTICQICSLPKNSLLSIFNLWFSLSRISIYLYLTTKRTTML